METLNFLFNILGPFFSLVISGWWIILPLVIAYYGTEAWKYYKYEEKRLSTKFVLLEIKIPRGIMKSPEAMERVFAGLHGPYDPPKDFEDFYLDPKIRLNYSFEIVGQDGDTRFYIHCPKSWRNVVEAQVYAQYPEVMIVEAEDYTKNAPQSFPNDEYGMWGLEFRFMKEDAYPILTYPEFKSLSDAKLEEVKVDPLSAISESFATMKPGEQMWYQILARPCGNPGITSAKDQWKEEGQAVVDKLAGKDKPKAQSRWAPYTEVATALLEEIPEHAAELIKPMSSSEERGLGRLLAPAKKDENKKEPSKMLHTTPGEKTVIESIERKIGKLGFECIVRIIYIGRNDVYDPANIGTMFSIIRQFNTQNLNSFRLNSATMTKKRSYFGGFIKSSKFLLDTKNGLLYFYRRRAPFWDNKKVLPLPIASRVSKAFSGFLYRLFPSQVEYMRSKTMVLNIEELATMYHFPGETVGSPTMPRMQAKKSEPPIGLPI